VWLLVWTLRASCSSAFIMSLQDSLELMESMRDLYSSQEDADKIRELRRMRGEIHAAFQQRELYMAELIRGAHAFVAVLCGSALTLRRIEMSQRVSSAEAKLALPEAAQQHAARVAELEASTAAAAAELDRLTLQSAELGGMQERLVVQHAALAAQRAEADAAARATEGELRRAARALRGSMRGSSQAAHARLDGLAGATCSCIAC
jgi:hypothetical protein